MNMKRNRLSEAVNARATECIPSDGWPVDQTSFGIIASTDADLSTPEMERRLRARSVWEFIDESKSSFYARMDESDPSYDPLFPKAIPNSSTGKGPKRWKLGHIITWLKTCEAVAKAADMKGTRHER